MIRAFVEDSAIKKIGCGARAGEGVMRPTGDGTGCDVAHNWLLPAEEQVDEQPADMVATARASDARQSK